MISNVFELYVRSLDGNAKSFNRYIRLNEDEAVVKDGSLMGITEKGWSKIGARGKHDRFYYEVKLLTTQDRINIMSALDYQIRELVKKRQSLELNTDEALLHEAVWQETFVDDDIRYFTTLDITDDK